MSVVADLELPVFAGIWINQKLGRITTTTQLMSSDNGDRNVLNPDWSKH